MNTCKLMRWREANKDCMQTRSEPGTRPSLDSCGYQQSIYIWVARPCLIKTTIPSRIQTPSLHSQTKNRHHDLAGSSAVGGALERGVVARGGRLEQARGCQRQVAVGSTCPGSSAADQPAPPHAPASTSDVFFAWSGFRQTRAVGRVRTGVAR